MTKQSIRSLLDRMMNGALNQRLADWRGAGLSFNDMAAELERAVGVRVTGQTVRNWCRDLETVAPLPVVRDESAPRVAS